jgi:hypothetical protein
MAQQLRGESGWRSLVGWTGVGAVALYVFATILGRILDPSYSHARHPVSELISSEAPDRMLLGALFITYNVMLLLFGLGLVRGVRRSRALRVGFAFIVVIAVGGVLLVTPFPQDSLGETGTPAGAVHIALAAVVSLLTVATAFLLGSALQRDLSWVAVSRFSFVMGFVILITGALAGSIVAVGGPAPGLFERLTIGAFLLWVLVVAAHALITARGGPPRVEKLAMASLGETGGGR